MNPEKRIAELEAQVRDLSRLVETMLGRQENEPFQSAYQEIQTKHSSCKPTSSQQIPAHVWLERFAALLGFVLLVLTAHFFEVSETFGNTQKLIAASAISLTLIGYGAVFRRLRDQFAETLAGCGLGGIYLTLYIAPTLVSSGPLGVTLSEWHLVMLTASLMLAGAVSLYAQSFIIAAITILVPYVTVIHGFHGEGAVDLGLMLTICPILALALLVIHLRNGWTILVGLAVLVNHGIYDLYLLEENAWSIEMGKTMALGGISACAFLFALAFVWSVMHFGCSDRVVALTALVNSVGYFVLVQPILLENYPAYYGKFCFAVAAIHAVLAMLTERRGSARNPLLQVYLLCTMLAYAIGLSAVLNGEWLAIAHAITCLFLVVCTRLTGVVIFKAYAVFFTLLTVGDMFAFTQIDAVAFNWEGYAVPANWFAVACVTFLLVLSCWFSEHFVRRRISGGRITNGQHAFAGTWLDARGPAVAIFQATAIAVILLTMIIFQFGEDPRLPYILGSGAFVIGISGLLLYTPPLEITSVLLLAAGHVCFHIFLWLPQPGFETQPYYTELTCTFAVVTYLGAHAWERYLNRLHFGKADWEHHAIAAFPHLAATSILAILLIRGLLPVQIPAALGLVATGLLSVGALTRLNGIKASGVAAVALAAYFFQLGLYSNATSIAKEEAFVFYFSAMLATFIVSERLFVVLQHYESFPSPIEDALRSALVFLSTVLSILGLQAWRPDDFLVYLLLTGLAMLLLGVLFREWRYWGAALATSGVILYWVATNFAELSRSQQVLAAGALLLVGVTILQVRSRQSSNSREVDDSHG